MWVRFEQFRFNVDVGELHHGEENVRLRPKTAQLLSLLLESPNEILDRDAIFELVWKGRIVSDNTLMQSVRELRVVLHDAAAQPRFIETVHGRGYRYIGPKPVKTQADNNHTNTIQALMRKSFSKPIAIALFGLALTLSASVVLYSVTTTPLGLSSNDDVNRAQESIARGELDLARQYYEAAILRDQNNLYARAGLATISYAVGDWARAWELVSEVANPESVITTRHHANLKLVAGEIAHAQGRLGIAEQNLTAAREIAIKTFSPLIHAAAVDALSYVYADQGRILEYLDIRSQALDPLLSSAQLEAFGEGLLSAGTTIHPTFNEDWSLERLLRALEVFEKVGDPIGAARAHGALGGNLALPTDIRRDHLHRALGIYHQQNHLPGEMAILLDQASLEIEQFKADDALDAIHRGQEIAQALGASRIYADFEYRRGLALMAAADAAPEDMWRDQMKTAISVFDEASAEFDEVGAVIDRLAPRFHAAIATLGLGDAQQALIEFQEMERLYHELPFPMGEFGAKLGQGAALATLGQIKEAKIRFDQIERGAPVTGPVLQRARALFIDGAEGEQPERALFHLVITAELLMAQSSPLSE